MSPSCRTPPTFPDDPKTAAPRTAWAAPGGGNPGETVGGDHYIRPHVVARAHGECAWPAQGLRRLRGGQGHRRGGASGRGVRVPRPQRCRQVLHDADDRGGVSTDRRRPAGARSRPGARRVRHPRAPRRVPAGGHARRGAVGAREPAHLRPLLRHQPARRGGQGGRAAGVLPARREARRPRRQPVRRHEATAHDRPVPRQRPRPAAPRRAHDRARPAGAAPAVGQAVPAQAPRRDARC